MYTRRDLKIDTFVARIFDFAGNKIRIVDFIDVFFVLCMRVRVFDNHLPPLPHVT